MTNDRCLSFDTRRSALAAIARVRRSRLLGPLGDGNTFEADLEPGVIHHREHAGEAPVRLADQVAEGTLAIVAETHDAGRARVYAEFVFDRNRPDIVTFTRFAVVADEELGHEEQRDAAHAFGRIRQPRQHQVQDIAGNVVIAPADVNLLSGEPVGIAVRHRARRHGRQIRTCLRLGQVHRARPLAADEFFEIDRLNLGRGVRVQCLDGARGKHRKQ